MRKSSGRLAVAGTAAAVLGASTVPAFATSPPPVPVPVTANNSVGQRTLALADGTGNVLDGTHGIALSPGRATSVVASVTDANYQTSGFQVTSTMSNLYQTASGGGYDYASPYLPSSSVSLSRSPVPLSLQAVGANVAPVFTLAGNLTSAIPAVSLIGLTPRIPLANTSVQVTGSLQNLVVVAGSTVDNTLAGLPLTVAGGTAGAYTNPLALSSSDTPAAGSTATTIPLISGTKSTTAAATLLTQLRTQLGTLTTATPLASGATPVISADDIVAALSNQLGLPTAVITSNLTAILGALVPTLTSLDPTGVTSLLGTYSGSNRLTVTPPANAVAGTFKGLLTVTLADTP